MKKDNDMKVSTHEIRRANELVAQFAPTTHEKQGCIGSYDIDGNFVINGKWRENTPYIMAVSFIRSCEWEEKKAEMDAKRREARLC